MTEILGLEPKKVFHYFYEINQIPRCSGDEKAIGERIKEMGRELGLEVQQDEAGNVAIRKPASPKYAKSPSVTLQGHMDMVCVKDENSAHDFTCEPIDMYVDGGWVRARGTTLGADNGIGVAMGMALLAEEEPMPALEVIVTTSEETGMDGAIGLKPEMITGDYLINIDSEEEGFMTAGCAGGSTGYIELPIEREKTDNKSFYRLKLDRLRGGHSGMQIREVSTTALKSLGEFLHKLAERVPYRLHDFASGDKHNAIPNAATATISIASDHFDSIHDAFEKTKEEMLEKLLKLEPDMRFTLEPLESANDALTADSATRLLNCIQLMPHGIYTMLADESGVETSDNFAVCRTGESSVQMVVSVRSSLELRRNELQQKIIDVCAIFGAKARFGDGYPAWEFEPKSHLREVFNAKYREMTGKDMEILVIHAGLECGLFAKKKPGLDMVSIGPDCLGAHTTKECLSVESVERTYALLKSVVKALAE